jgi:CheY-like chemotaxis protein
MAIKNPRIIIVEENQGIALLVRASLDLLGRRPRLIECHTGEDAWDELHLRTPDLLITAQSLVGEMQGPDLAETAKSEIAALPVIVLGAESDPEPTAQQVEDASFQYLRRPLVPELFIRALRFALDGPESIPMDDAPLDTMGPVPQVDTDRLRPIALRLMRDVGAMSYVIADRNGKVLAYDGMAGYVDRDLLAAVVGPSVGSVARMMGFLGATPRVLKYFDGDKFDVYVLAIGVHYLLSLVFDGATGNRALGNVARFGRASVDEMLTLMGDAAYKLQTLLPQETAKITAAAQQAASAPSSAPAPDEPRQKQRIRRTQEVPISKPELPPEPPPPMPTLDPIADFDVSILDALGSVDLSQADAMFDPDHLASVVNTINTGNRLSREDAEAQGLINLQQE